MTHEILLAGLDWPLTFIKSYIEQDFKDLGLVSQNEQTFKNETNIRREAVEHYQLSSEVV